MPKSAAKRDAWAPLDPHHPGGPSLNRPFRKGRTYSAAQANAAAAKVEIDFTSEAHAAEVVDSVDDDATCARGRPRACSPSQRKSVDHAALGANCFRVTRGDEELSSANYIPRLAARSRRRQPRQVISTPDALIADKVKQKDFPTSCSPSERGLLV